MLVAYERVKSPGESLMHEAWVALFAGFFARTLLLPGTSTAGSPCWSSYRP